MSLPVSWPKAIYITNKIIPNEWDFSINCRNVGVDWKRYEVGEEDFPLAIENAKKLVESFRGKKWHEVVFPDSLLYCSIARETDRQERITD
jgi:hypothetical protein